MGAECEGTLTDYMTHAACWRDPPVSTLNGLCDLGIGITYLAIAAILVQIYIEFAPFSRKFWNKRYYLAFAFFGAFICACGVGHLLDFAATWWWPEYKVIGWWRRYWNFWPRRRQWKWNLHSSLYSRHIRKSHYDRSYSKWFTPLSHYINSRCQQCHYKSNKS